ncbi:PAS domain S-box-containing protein [Verrucomicrobium sp. GAS474]|uniref:ATP-binding protein n=1 Tax=Verrucomicrobium sp. GAS474 TaxID=1882831 RepID=UPI00087D82E4|nr:ATP-binding protein [Verrucomicrobium sp. GAS474]SDU19564.1 PAS domain S-box-containing protein [Verrucomicrobium sp. GAS474]
METSSEPVAPLLPLSQIRKRLFLYLRLFAGCRRTVATLAIICGILVLVGWSYDITLFKTLYVGTAAMRPLSAIMLILIGCSLLLFGKRSGWTPATRFGFGLALVFSAAALYTTAHSFFGWNTPLDPYLYSSSPDRILRNSSTGCTILLSQAFALILLWRGRQLAAQTLALFCLALTYFSLTGYMYNMAEFQSIPFFNSLSLPFLVLYSLTAVGILAARPQQGLLREVISEDPGGMMARWLLPIGFLLPLGTGLVHLHNLDSHYYGPSVALGLTALSSTALFCLAVWFCARGLNQTYGKLRRRERLYAVLSECNQSIIRLSDRAPLFETICRSLVETGEFQAAWVAERTAPAQGARDHFLVFTARGLGAETLREETAIAPHPGGPREHPLLRAISENGRIDLEASPHAAPWDRLVPSERPGSLAICPLYLHDQVDALLVVHCARKDVLDADNRRLLDEVAGDISHALTLMNERRIHRQAEERLHETTSRLGEALAKNPTLFYSLQVGTGKNGGIVPDYISENVNGILGYSVDEAMRPSWWTAHLHPDDHDRPGSLSLPPPDRNTVTRDFRFQANDGSYVWIRDEQRAIRDAEGRPVKLVGSWSDITERIHLEEQFRHTQKFESLGRLTGGVAHDLNNILTVIDGHASLLETDCSEESRESIEEILQATNRATRLTRQLLTFSRKQFIEPKNLNLNTVIGDMGKMLRRSVGEDIDILFETDATLPTIFADEGMIEQILLNLVVNARDAMPKGGVIRIGTARTRLERSHASIDGEVAPGDYVRFSVSDTGCGIPSSHLLKIFDPFFTTKDPDKGTGLGLATVRNIVRQHGGTLTVASEPDRGTTFHIYLPVAAAVPLPAREKQEKLKSVKKESGAVILLVEDDAAVRSMMKSILTHVGHQVIEAPTALEAIKAYETTSQGIDLLLADVVLPGGISGRDLAQQLRAIQDDLPVLYVTGYATLPKEYGFRDEENRDFLRKPFTSVDLIENVRARLAGALKPV